MNNILVIEPHPDDAFLCLHDHLGAWKETANVKLLTVFANPAREREAFSYAESVGIAFDCLRLEEAEMTGGSSPRLIGGLLKYLRQDTEADRVVCPLGLQHPDHISVRRTVDREGLPTWYYLDSPYQTKQKNRDDLQTAIAGMRIVSMRYPGNRKWYGKKIFKSQSRFFHYNPFEEWKLAELVMEPPTTE